MMTTTPQELGRTANVHDHDDLDSVYFDSLAREILRCDFRANLAMLTCIDLHLGEHRAAAIGATWNDVRGEVLDPARLAEDLHSKDPERRRLAMNARAAVRDFLVCRKARSRHGIPAQLSRTLKAIEQRTHELERARTRNELPSHNLPKPPRR